MKLFGFANKKKQTGDYQILAKILKTTVDAARMRYHRKDRHAILMLYYIIEQRENFTNKLANK